MKTATALLKSAGDGEGGEGGSKKGGEWDQVRAINKCPGHVNTTKQPYLSPTMFMSTISRLVRYSHFTVLIYVLLS